MTPLNTTLCIAPVELHTTTKIHPAGKEYLCLHINGRSSHDAQYVKSRIRNKVIYYILSIDKFEHQCFVNKCFLQLPRLDDNMKTIGIDQ